MDLVTLSLVKKWLRIERDYSEEDEVLLLLMDNAEVYVKKGAGAHYKSNHENTMQAKNIALMLITNWYENRDFSGTTDKLGEGLRYTIRSMMLQLQNSEV